MADMLEGLYNFTCCYYISKMLEFSSVCQTIGFKNEIKLIMSLRKYVAANLLEMAVALQRSRHRCTPL